MVDKERVMDALRDVYDPEIPVSVVDLGLIYKVEIEDSKVDVAMTMTAVGCPMHAYIAQEVRQKLLALEGVEEVTVNIVWEPKWTPEMMSDEAKKKLGFA